MLRGQCQWAIMRGYTSVYRLFRAFLNKNVCSYEQPAVAIFNVEKLSFFFTYIAFFINIRFKKLS